MKYLYRIYQIVIALPIIIFLTLLTALTTSVGCILGNGHFWGYYPPVIWSKGVRGVMCRPVKGTGGENQRHGESYVFVSNHQGVFDIFLISGHLHRNFKWMRKQKLRKIPFVGYACEKSHHIFVDRRNPAKMMATYDKARATLKHGMSLVVFPEGSRTYDGRIGKFKRGAFVLADELQLPVVPLTINGSFDVMPRTSKWYWVHRRRLTLTIHAPIYPQSQGAENVARLMEESRKVIESGLDEKYK